MGSDSAGRVAEAAWGGSPVGGVVTDSGSAGLSSLTALEGGFTRRADARERGGPSVVITLTLAPTYGAFGMSGPAHGIAPLVRAVPHHS